MLSVEIRDPRSLESRAGFLVLMPRRGKYVENDRAFRACSESVLDVTGRAPEVARADFDFLALLYSQAGAAYAESPLFLWM